MSLKTSPAQVDEIRSRYETIRERIATACGRVGRDPAGVRIIAVTKTFSAETVAAAIGAGLKDFGENRVQELEEKASLIAGLQAGGNVRWHLVGSLQRNKAKTVAEIADEFHALDTIRLARELDKRAHARGRVLPCYVQVNVSGEETKSGVPPEAAHDFLDGLEEFSGLRVVGLMTLASPADHDEDLERLVRPELRTLARLARDYDELRRSHTPEKLRLSMGMSGDFEVAVEEGATDVRLGTLLFGAREA